MLPLGARICPPLKRYPFEPCRGKSFGKAGPFREVLFCVIIGEPWCCISQETRTRWRRNNHLARRNLVRMSAFTHKLYELPRAACYRRR
jgi:hypothetical protein